MLKSQKTSLPTRSQILSSIGMSKSKQNLQQFTFSSLSMASSPKEPNNKNNNMRNLDKKSNSLKMKNHQLPLNHQQNMKVNIQEDKENIQKNANPNYIELIQPKKEDELKQLIQQSHKSYSVNSMKKQDKIQNSTQLSLSAAKSKIAYGLISLNPVFERKQRTNHSENIHQKHTSSQARIILQEDQFQPKQLSIDESNFHNQDSKINKNNQKDLVCESRRQSKSKLNIPNNMISYKQFTQNFQEKLKEQKIKKQALKETTQRLITQTSKQNLRTSHNRKQESLNKDYKNTQNHKTKTIEDQKCINQNEKLNKTEKLKPKNEKTTNSISQISKISQMCSPKSYIKINDFANSLPQSLNTSIQKSKSKINSNNNNSNKDFNLVKKEKKELVIQIEQLQGQHHNKQEQNKNVYNCQLNQCTCHQYFNNWGFLLYESSLSLEQQNTSTQKIIQKMFQKMSQKASSHQKNHLSLFMYQLKQFINKILQNSSKNSKRIYTNILDNEIMTSGQSKNMSNQTMKVSLHKNQENQQQSHKKIKIHLKTKSSSRKQIINDSLIEKGQRQIAKKLLQENTQKTKIQDHSKKRLRVSNKKQYNQQVNQIQSIIQSFSKNNSLMNNSSSQTNKNYEISPFTQDKNSQQREYQKRQNSFFLKNSKTQAICGISSIGHSFGNSIDISMFQDPLHMLQIPYSQQLFQDNSLVLNENKDKNKVYCKKWSNNASTQLPKSTIVVKKNK